MTNEIKIIRTWTEHPRGKDENGRRKKPVLKVRYFDRISQKQAQISMTIESDSLSARNNALAQIKSQIQSEYAKITEKDITIKDLAEKYYEFMDNDTSLKYQTRYQYIQHIKDFMTVAVPTTLVNDIDITYFSKYLSTMLLDYSYSYVNTRKMALSNLFKFGIKNGYAKLNPLAGYKLKKKIQPKTQSGTEHNCFTPQELKAVFQYLRDIKRVDYLDLFEFMYLTGMRLAEAASLHSSDIITKGTKTYAVIAGTQITKHNSVNKRIKGQKISSNNAQVLEKQKAAEDKSELKFVELNSLAIKIVNKHLNSDSYLFKIGDNITDNKTGKLQLSVIGNPFQNTTVNKYVKTVASHVGVSIDQKYLTSNIFRRTYISKTKDQQHENQYQMVDDFILEGVTSHA